MRGQWQSQTRRLNRHYQSGGGEPVPWTLFDVPYESDKIWSTWDGGKGYTRLRESPYSQASTETYKTGQASLATSAQITGTSMPIVFTYPEWGYFPETNRQFWDERVPIVTPPGTTIAGATVRENGPKNIQNRLWLSAKGRFHRDKLIRCRITIISDVVSGIEPEYYILRFQAGGSGYFHFYCGDQFHMGAGRPDLGYPNPDAQPALTYAVSALGIMRNDNYQTAQTGTQFYTNIAQTTYTYGKKLVDQDAQGRYYIEYILLPQSIWSAFDQLDPGHTDYDRFSFGFDYGIESIATATDMELRSMIQFWEEDLP